MIVLWQQSDGQLLTRAQTIIVNPDATIWTEITGFIAIIGTMISYFSAVLLNFPDFSRYAKGKRLVILGNLAGRPLNMIIFSALALLTTAGAAVVYGDAIINPTEIVETADIIILSIIAAITFFAATVSINTAAVFSGAHDRQIRRDTLGRNPVCAINARHQRRFLLRNGAGGGLPENSICIANSVLSVSHLNENMSPTSSIRY